MRQAVAALALVVLATAGAIFLDGFAAFGRLTLSLGLSSLAAPLLDDPLWKGVALYRAGRYDEAVTALRTAGPSGFYDRGNALARAGRFHEAVEVYDAALYRSPNDDDARTNRALVSALIAVVSEAQAAEGVIPDASLATEGESQSGEAAAAAAEAKLHERVQKAFVGQAVIASRQWLATLADEPGRYLKLRLAAERERRLRLGTAMAPAGDPW